MRNAAAGTKTRNKQHLLVDVDFRDTVAWVPFYLTNVHRDGQVRSGLRVSSNFLPAKRGYQQTSIVTLEYKIRGNVNSAGSFFLSNVFKHPGVWVLLWEFTGNQPGFRLPRFERSLGPWGQGSGPRVASLGCKFFREEF